MAGASAPSAPKNPAPASATSGPKAQSSGAGAATQTGAKKSKSAAKATGAGTKAKPKKPAARKKKSPTKAMSAATAQNIVNEARAAKIELAHQRAITAARKSDPLWFRVEDILPTIQDSSRTSVFPEQVKVVEAALGNNGLSRGDVTPQAMACLLEQVRRYAQELAADAQDYAYTANRADVAPEDLKLAAEFRADHPVSMTTQLPKLNIVAQQVNRAPLPPIPSQCYSGILLPPKEHQLTARTYDVISGARVTQKMVQRAPSIAAKKSKKTVTNQPSYGATKGCQIPVKLKGQPQEKDTSQVSQTSKSSEPSGPIPMEIEPVTDSSKPQPSATDSATTLNPTATTSTSTPATASAPGAPASSAQTQTTATASSSTGPPPAS